MKEPFEMKSAFVPPPGGAAPAPGRPDADGVCLSHVASGTRVTVRRIDDRDDALSRLMAMGLCEGREVEVVRQGNPLILRLLGARIGISGRLAQRIVVDRSAD